MLVVCGVQGADAQGKAPDGNGFPAADLLRETMDISYSTPGGFRYVKERKAVRIHERATVGMIYFQFESNDSNCKLFLTTVPIYLPDYSEYSSKLWHRSNMRAELTDIMGTKDLNMDDYVTAIAGKEARDRFNADSVFTFDVPKFEPLEGEERFTHCSRMYISRKERPMIMLVWLFTPEGEEREWKYIEKLDGRVWYDNGSWTPRKHWKKEAEYWI